MRLQRLADLSRLTLDLDHAAVTNALNLYVRGFGQHKVSIDQFHGEPGPDQLMARATIACDSVTLAGDSEHRRLAQASIAHAVGHLRHSTFGRPVEKRKPLLVAVIGLIEDARIERLMIDGFPGLRKLWGTYHAQSAIDHADSLTFTALSARLATAIHDPTYTDGNYWIIKGRSMFHEACRDLEDTERFESMAKVLANDLGQMRVPFDVSSYLTQPRYRDDNSCLWTFDGQATASATRDSRADASTNGSSLTTDTREGLHAKVETAPAPVSWLYPEWNYRSGHLRDGWTTLVDMPAPATVVPPGLRQRPETARHLLKPR